MSSNTPDSGQAAQIAALTKMVTDLTTKFTNQPSNADLVQQIIDLQNRLRDSEAGSSNGGRHLVHTCTAITGSQIGLPAAFGDDVPLLSGNHKVCPYCGMGTEKMSLASEAQVALLQGI
jgi:hypothetical protein